MDAQNNEPLNLKETPLDDPEAIAMMEELEGIVSAEEWKKLASLTGEDKSRPYLRILNVPPSVTFINKGEFDMHIFIVLEGVVEAILVDETGVEKAAKKLYPGRCIGELAVIKEIARIADVRASAGGAARLLKIDWTITGKLEHSECLVPLLKLILKKTAKNTSSGYDAIAHVIEKANGIMSSHNDVIGKLRAENRRLEKVVSQKKAIIIQTKRLLKSKGVEFEEKAPVIYATEEPASDINIHAAIELLQNALSQIDSK